jgi:hypothetical protein
MLTNMNTLKKYKLVYLATPYSKYADGLENAANDAAKIAAKLLQAGVAIYSPIVYTHQLAVHGNLDPLNHSLWLPFDQPFLDVSECLCVLKLPGWDESFGIAFEIKDFTSKGKMIVYLDPLTMNISEEP